jgi:hypothetical protein
VPDKGFKGTQTIPVYGKSGAVPATVNEELLAITTEADALGRGEKSDDS